MSLYWVKKVKGKKQRVWNYARFRGLSEAKERIGDLAKESRFLLKNKNKIRVLEIGCGYGKVLLELKKIYGDKINTYGINLEPRWNVKLVKKFGLAERIFTKREIDKNLPKIYILDAGKKMPLKSSNFDLIFAQATVQYIGDKALFLQEVNRLLTKEGKAIIEMQEIKKSHPREYRNLFEIWDNSHGKKAKKIDSIKYLRNFKNIQIKKSKTDKNWHILIIKKSKKLNLKLKFIDSIDLNKINPNWWGSKAIYVVK